VIAAVLFNFAPLAERTAAMKVTLRKGLFRLVTVGAGVLIGLPFARSFSFLVVCALLCVGWVLYWLIGGFFDME